MATPISNDFKLPISGDAIKWRPLKVGEQIDLTAAYQGAQAAYRGAAMLAARVISCGAKPGVSLGDIKDWDEVDYMAFDDAVSTWEAQRQQALMKRLPAAQANEKLQACLNAARDAAIAFINAASEAHQAAMAAQVAARTDNPLT